MVKHYCIWFELTCISLYFNIIPWHLLVAWPTEVQNSAFCSSYVLESNTKWKLIEQVCGSKDVSRYVIRACLTDTTDGSKSDSQCVVSHAHQWIRQDKHLHGSANPWITCHTTVPGPCCECLPLLIINPFLICSSRENTKGNVKFQKSFDNTFSIDMLINEFVKISICMDRLTHGSRATLQVPCCECLPY